MRNILDYIEKIKSENEGPRITVQEPRNMNQASLADDLEPGPLKDEMLKGFDPSQETHEEYLQRINLERPFNMVEGGRIGFATGSPGANMQEILNAYKEYKRSHHRGKRRSPIIPFRKFFEIYAEENMAEGGRAGYNDGQLVTPSVDGSRPGYKGKELHYLYTPEVRQKILETRKRKFQKTDPLGKRLQWIADNGKNYDSPLEMKKAYEKYFKHKIGTKADALFYTVEGGLGVTKKLGVDNAEVLIKRIYLDQIDNLINPSKQKRGVVSFTKRFSEDELFKASIIQNNPKVRNKFIDLFADINKNAGTYAAELGPEEMVLKLKSKGGYLLDGYEKGGFDFLFSYPRPGAPEQTIGGVHRGITRNTLINAGIPVEHIKSFQLVRKPLESIEEVLRKVSKNPNYAKKVWGVGAGTSQKIASQLNNFLEGQTEARKIIRDLDTMFIKGQMNKEGYTGTVDSYLKTDAGKASRYNFTKVFGGVQFDHTLAKSIGRDYKYLPRNYLLKGQFTTGKFNRIKKDIFDLPLIEMLKKYEKGKISGTEIKNFIDDFNKKTGGYADFTFDEKKGKIVYPQEKKVTYDLSRYSNPEVVAKELEKNIRMTMSKEFQEGYKGIIPKEDLKGFKSKEASNILKDLKVLCPKGKASGGRIGYKAAGVVGGTLECGINQFNKNMKTGNANSALMRRILASGGNILKGAAQQLNPAELLRLRNLIGPQALGFFAAYEAGVITDDHLRKGTPWNEAFAKNWLTKSFMPYSEEFAKQKNLLQSGKLNTDAQRIYALDMMKAEKAWKEMNRIDGMKFDQTLEQGGYGMIDESQIVTDEAIEDAEANVNRIIGDLESRDSFTNTGKQMENIAAMTEMEASRMAKPKTFNIGDMEIQYSDGYSPIFGKLGTRLVNKLAAPPRKRTGPMTAKREMKIDYSLPTYDRTNITEQDVLNMYKDEGWISPTDYKSGMKLSPGELTWWKMQNPGRGTYGTQEKFMGGGIVGIRKPSAIPPEKGGLRSIMINGKKS